VSGPQALAQVPSAVRRQASFFVESDLSLVAAVGMFGGAGLWSWSSGVPVETRQFWAAKAGVGQLAASLRTPAFHCDPLGLVLSQAAQSDTGVLGGDSY
jgi:hypothetical protein